LRVKSGKYNVGQAGHKEKKSVDGAYAKVIINDSAKEIRPFFEDNIS